MQHIYILVYIIYIPEERGTGVVIFYNALQICLLLLYPDY